MRLGRVMVTFAIPESASSFHAFPPRRVTRLNPQPVSPSACLCERSGRPAAGVPPARSPAGRPDRLVGRGLDDLDGPSAPAPHRPPPRQRRAPAAALLADALLERPGGRAGLQ